MKYYKLDFSWGYKGGWTLGGLKDYGDDEWAFVKGGAVIGQFPKLSVEIVYAKNQEKDDFNPLDLSLVPSIKALIGNEKARSIFPSDEVQSIPVVIRNSEQPIHYIFPIIHTYDCIDYQKSDIEYWEVGNKVRPDLAGEIQLMNSIVLDNNKLGDAQIFRLMKKYTIIIVREDLMKKIKKQLSMDLKFTLVG